MRKLLLLAAVLLAAGVSAQEPEVKLDPVEAPVQSVETEKPSPEVAAQPVEEVVQSPEETVEPKVVIGKYRRSSLYTMFIAHPDQEFGGQISEAFMMMPTPDKFDDHNIGQEYKTIISTVGSRKKSKKSDANFPDVNAHMAQYKIPTMLVAKWFNYNAADGTFDMSVVSERGNYDATLADVALADMSARGRAELADAGEALIGKTFVLVNDITYIDKSERTAAAGGVLKFLGGLVGAMYDSNVGAALTTVGAVTEQFGGFSVRITSYLYRLDWNEEVAATFYQDLWHDASAPSPERAQAFVNSDLFRLVYVGNHSATKGNVTINGFQEETDAALISKVCTRALDAAVVELQRKYDEFKVAVPIQSVGEDGSVYVQVGLKEGINEKSRLEVLEQIELADGSTDYRRVAVIVPVKGEIWDNRFMAAEEASAMAAQGVADNTDPDAAGGNVNLTATRFRREGAGRIYPGLLVREITIR